MTSQHSALVALGQTKTPPTGGGVSGCLKGRRKEVQPDDPWGPHSPNA